MKFRKLISKTLAVGLLFNSTSTSLAGILSEDGRYETFEGNNITIDNILEDGEVDVEIEGNTMVNIANQKDPVSITKSYTVEGTNHIPLQGEYDGKAKPVIEGNTLYYNNDTGEYSDTFIEGANLSLVSSFEDQLVTQEMVDSGQEKAENLGKYKVECKVAGKNLFNIDGNVNQYYESMSVGSGNTGNVIEDNKLIANLFSYSHHGKGQLIKVQPNTNYTISVDVSENEGVVVIHTATKNNYHFKYFSIGHHETTFNTGDNQEICLAFITSGDSTTTKAVFSNIQLEERSDATEYKPYKESTKILYLSSPLLEGDTIEEVDGKITHVRRYNKIVLDGLDDGNWIDSGFNTDNTMLFRLVIKDMINGSPRINNVFSDSFKTSISDIYNGDYECIIPNEGVYNNINIRIYKTKLLTQDVEGFKEWLKTNPITLVYKLDRPIYETISEESALIDSYPKGYLDLNSNVHIDKIDFMPTTTSLNYLYPSTEYTVQFESDNKGKIDTVSLGDEVLYSNHTVNKGINRFNITTPSEILSTELILNGIGFNLSNLVVTQATDESFSYFEGIKSVGQDDINSHRIELISNNKNLYKPHLYHEGLYGLNFNLINDKLYVSGTASDIFDYRPVTATSNMDLFELLNKLPAGTDISISNNLGLSSYFSVIRNGKQTYVREKITIEKDDYDISCFVRFEPNGETYNNQELLIQIELSNIPSGFMEYQSNRIEIPLREPLRGIPNGVKDRIIKRNGQWMIERNCGQAILDGSEGWYGWNSNKVETHAFRLNFNDISHIASYRRATIVSDTLSHESFGKVWDGNAILDKSISAGDPNGFTDRSSIYIRNTDFTTEQVNEFKEWLSINPVTIVYELENPIYEPLKIDSTINTYIDVTHISNNSNIPANMKVTVDRTINRATEAIELFKLNPTTENLSKARMWVNLLDESIKKDELQSEINSITNLDDMTLERKTATANLDVYVMCENMLSMSLNTNSITFDNYSGVEDMEKPNALEISINSSLPYDLNAYLQTEIKGSENSNVMDMDILKIKDSSKNNYQSFANTTDKVILDEDCSSGNYISHSIDLKLESSNAYSVDVYKTTIKFEAVQK